jgi:hypothetical protein
MPLPLPNLADRSFKELKAEAERVVRANCPAWTDFTPGDPGTTLIEAFAFLTEVMLYRLNRVPEKVQVALLNLLGVAPRPPAAATVRLVFSRAEPGPAPLLVPRGTRVADKRAELRFVTLEDATIPADGTEASVLAVHAERVEGELLGLGSGRAGQSLRLRHVPLLRPNQQLPTLEIGVAAPAGPADGVPPLEAAGQRFQLWQEVESFLAARAEPRPFLVDRATGVVTFGGGGARDDPARLPPEGAEIRAWYWHGGGRAGNAGAGTLTVPEGAPSGIAVTNPLPATGGEDGETLEEAVARGREEVRTVGTAVTARDFETVARLPGGIARARARAAREQWVFGEPGVVQVGLVPEVRRPAGVGAVTPEKLAERQTPELLDRVARLLAERTPLGVRTAVGWVRCRPVGVSARVVVAPVEDPEAVEARLRARLDRLLAPDGSWPFDRPLRASDAYEALLAEPGVRYVEELAFRIESGPEARVDDVLRDPCQPGAWFAATATGLFRSLDAGRSWALLAGGLPEGAVRLVRADRDMPGLLAAVAPRGNKATAIHVSRDGGESWTQAELLEDEKVYDAAWLTREGRPTLFLATERALRRLDPAAGEGSAPVETAPRGEAAPDGFRAVATGRHPMGVHFVAVALREKKGGVLLSREGGEARSAPAARGATSAASASSATATAPSFGPPSRPRPGRRARACCGPRRAPTASTPAAGWWWAGAGRAAAATASTSPAGAWWRPATGMACSPCPSAPTGPPGRQPPRIAACPARPRRSPSIPCRRSRRRRGHWCWPARAAGSMPPPTARRMRRPGRACCARRRRCRRAGSTAPARMPCA